MAHIVRFGIPTRDLGKADVEFYIWNNKVRVGTLLISKGTVVWFSKGAKVGRRIGWKRFCGLMEQHGRRRERR